MKSNPNEQLLDRAKTASACGMSYGEWVSKGRPEPSKAYINEKTTEGKPKRRRLNGNCKMN